MQEDLFRLPQRCFVTGIHTDVGKTMVAAAMVAHLGADYWKPVQAGLEPQTDSQRVAELAGPRLGRIWPERYRLHKPCSPHEAAAAEGLSLSLEDFELPPDTGQPLVVEGAGGLMVPLNDQNSILDLAKRLKLPLVLVIRHYLGSINHSLLSLAQIEQAGLNLAGLVFNGPANPASEQAILARSTAPVLFRLEEIPQPYPLSEIRKFMRPFSPAKLEV